MSNNKACSSLHQIVHRFLDHFFCTGINGTCRLIQNQDLRICKDCPCNCEELFLSLGYITCFFIQFHIVSSRKCLDETMHMCRLRCLNHFFLCRIQFSITDIVTDRTMEQPGILQNHSEHFTEFTSIEVPDIMSVNLDRTSIHIIETHEQFDHCCLSGSCRTNNCDLLAFFHIR